MHKHNLKVVVLTHTVNMLTMPMITPPVSFILLGVRHTKKAITLLLVYMEFFI